MRGDDPRYVAGDDEDDLRPPDARGRRDSLPEPVLPEPAGVPAVPERVHEDGERRLAGDQDVVEVVRGEVDRRDRDQRGRIASGRLGDAALAEECAHEQEGQDEGGHDRQHQACPEQVDVAAEPAPVVEEPPFEGGEAVRLRPAVVDDGGERRQDERAAAARERGVGPDSGAEEAQPHGALLRRRREPVVRRARLELGRREAGKGPREDGEELDVAEPGLGAEEGRAEDRRHAVDEHRGGHGARLLGRIPDQLGPAPAQEEHDRRPLPEPIRVRERRDAAPSQEPVDGARGRRQRADEVPHVPDERRDESEPDPEVDPDEHGRRVLEELPGLDGAPAQAAEEDEAEQDRREHEPDRAEPKTPQSGVEVAGAPCRAFALADGEGGRRRREPDGRARGEHVDPDREREPVRDRRRVGEQAHRRRSSGRSSFATRSNTPGSTVPAGEKRSGG